IARRFGGRGLAVLVVVAAVMGPVRDKSFAKRFPEGGAFAPGVAAGLAISAGYVLFGGVGDGINRLVVGSSRGSALARQPWPVGGRRAIRCSQPSPPCCFLGHPGSARRARRLSSPFGESMSVITENES